MPKNRDQEFGRLDPEPLPEAVAVPMTKAGDEKKPVEVWAHEKGMLPEKLAPIAAFNAAPLGSGVNPRFWMFAAAKAGSNWPIGAEVTEQEFDAAVEKAQNGVSR